MSEKAKRTRAALEAEVVREPSTGTFSVRVARREQIDYDKLAFALVEIAKRQIEEKRLDESQEGQDKDGSTATKDDAGPH